MSSSDEVELKAGHPPAVKAGGMRVSRTRQTSTGEAAKPADVDKEEQEEYEEAPTKEDKANLVVSGALAKGDQDFPPEAIKSFHEKPVPNKVNRPANPQQKHNIQQPR